MNLQHMSFSINEFFAISFFKTYSQPLSIIQRNEHVEMNNFSCSLSCTWMTKQTVYFMLLAANLEIFHGSILLSC